MTKRYFDSPAPRLLAHRGLAREAPENTLAAFVAALSVGADYLETDARASSDGVAVLHHDAELRLPERHGRAAREVVIADTPALALERLDLGGGSGVPSLASALDGLPEARFNIDVKSADAIGPVVEAVRRAKARDRVLLTSFDAGRRRRAAAALPGVATSAAAPRVLLAAVGAGLGLQPLVQLAARGIDALQVPERQGPLTIVDRRRIAAYHRAGLEVHVWTVNAPAEMERLLDLGVDGIVTDRADLAAPIIAARR
ncbi:glycerophosphodiester phosphodiesterase family protein [Arenivirga flava]|uniref:Glycerophosphoryl diester phosphodiesterase n=1 Tax=Arenivirga flava TaxID=1930060 RepID=A0AA37XBJ4_9MICO|nr:glycerophosphodiester phosphodiesterase family protein [Arenivirga flava]GMA27482.1 glycerophosphoryl diester phosphodiesterase [Arenivirga flava]